jgi:hypothetical protein
MAQERTGAEVLPQLVRDFGFDYDTPDSRKGKRAPETPAELHQFCRAIQSSLGERPRLLRATPLGNSALERGPDCTGLVEAVWMVLRRIAGFAADPPRLDPGPHDRLSAVAALDQVTQWCAAQGRNAKGADAQKDPIEKVEYLLCMCVNDALLLHICATSSAPESDETLERAREAYCGCSGDDRDFQRGLAAHWADLRALDTTAWRDLRGWKFLDQVIRIFNESASPDWRAKWITAVPRLRGLTPNFENGFDVIGDCRARAKALRGAAPPTPAAHPLDHTGTGEGGGAGADRNQGGAGQVEAAAVGDKARPRIPKDEANIIVRDFLKDNPDATARQVAKGCQIAVGRVSGLPAWRAHQVNKKGSARTRTPKEDRRLTSKMLHVIGKEADPAEKMDKEEAAWRYLLENARTDEERARLNSMSRDEKANAIQMVLEQFADQLRDERS